MEGLRSTERPPTDNRFRPLVAVDVDGVLRIPKPRPGEDTRTTAVQVTMTRAQFPKWFHRAPRWDRHGRYTAENHFSTVAISWVRSLVARGVDVRWCSTWGSYANAYFVRPLGLPDLPVITDPPRSDEDAVLWKVRIISRVSRGRPVLWVDDNAWDEGLRYAHTPRALARAHHVNAASGITTADVTAMDGWLALASSPDGHDELRRQWRRHRDRQRRFGVSPFPPEWSAMLKGER